jgi:hypothetical protein
MNDTAMSRALALALARMLEANPEAKIVTEAERKLVIVALRHYAQRER